MAVTRSAVNPLDPGGSRWQTRCRMQGSGNSRGWLIHLTAGMALGAAVVLVVWISAGGRPFGRIIGEPDVSAPTSAAVTRAAGVKRAEAPAKGSARLVARPPALKQSPELEFGKPKAKANVAKRAAPKTRTAQPRRTRRKARSRRTPVIRVVSPPPADTGETLDTPVAAVPESVAAPPPAPAPAPSGGGGGGEPAKPKAPSYVTGAGEG